MENAALLSPADVNVIRRYVQTKYAPLSGAKRAEIVATAIRQTIQRRLPELPAEFKERIADDLIRRCLVVEQREIRPDDVLDVCAEIELPDPSAEAMFLDPILRWMNERAPGKWSPELLMNRLLRKEPAAVLAQAEFSAEFGTLAAEALPLPALPRTRPGWDIFGRVPRPALAMAVLVLAGGIAAGVLLGRPAPETSEQPLPSPVLQLPVPSADVGMPTQLRYRDIDTAAVKSYLRSRDSMLADEPYFSAIVNSAKEHDVNPLLLFAVTGQEQGFVPKSNKNAKKIANNPFNVFYSWEEFNTDIGDSADIAARTLSRQGSKRPEGYEPFDWLNQTYAEDPNWSDGVKRIFDKLNSLPPSSYK
ncbi:glucosaminidase domain-containing protein [Cohnella candidum]|uniref:Uncharacterized protein n=1 Tax=Cohnella candidum TaxID=2674991 RepID=A0A3G3JWF1_9BACL|nr:glucosaminidase domain-containing protein [Cohnella candidum]AYQ72558.1 hypothetical protein EAV92_08245 [Cohnella candidum]